VVALTVYSKTGYGPYNNTVLSLHDPRDVLHCHCQRWCVTFRSFCDLRSLFTFLVMRIRTVPLQSARTFCSVSIPFAVIHSMYL